MEGIHDIPLDSIEIEGKIAFKGITKGMEWIYQKLNGMEGM